MKATVAYIANDLSDPAVHRLVHALVQGGADLRLMGFRRCAEPVPHVHGIEAFDFGQTSDGKLAARAASVLRERFVARRYKDQIKDANIIMARNLDCLILAHDAQAMRGGEPVLIYECLDIHRVMVGERLPSRLMRALEAHYLKKVSGLVVSSPAFMREHFDRYQPTTPPFFLRENKFREGTSSAAQTERKSGPPWRIGWFGMLRCLRSLEMLSQITAALDGRLEVIMRGKIVLPEKEPFLELIERSKYIRYEGPYRYDDIPSIYSEVHYAWAIDYFQEGGNSTWLLPNRLYESIAQGAVPIALEGVETANWLKAHQCGLLLKEPVADLVKFFTDTSFDDYLEQRKKIAAVPRSDVVTDDRDDIALVDFLLNPDQKRKRA